MKSFSQPSKSWFWFLGITTALAILILVNRLTFASPHAFKHLGSMTGGILMILVIWEFLFFICKKLLPTKSKVSTKILKFFRACHCPIGRIFMGIILLHLACTLTFPPCLVQITGLLTACCFFWGIHKMLPNTAKKSLSAHRYITLLGVVFMIVHVMNHAHH